MYGESLHEETINAIQRLQDIHYPLPGQWRRALRAPPGNVERPERPLRRCPVMHAPCRRQRLLVVDSAGHLRWLSACDAACRVASRQPADPWLQTDAGHGLRNV